MAINGPRVPVGMCMPATLKRKQAPLNIQYVAQDPAHPKIAGHEWHNQEVMDPKFGHNIADVTDLCARVSNRPWPLTMTDINPKKQFEQASDQY